MDILLCFAAIASLVWFWADSARAREQMLRRCRTLCEELDVQLLDQTVGLARLALGRSLQGRIQLRRWYAFEYSINGTDRWHGMAELRGRHVESIRMEHPDGPVIVANGRQINVS
jgi:hypothetical protein